MQMALKVQLIDKNWYAAAVQTQNLIQEDLFLDFYEKFTAGNPKIVVAEEKDAEGLGKSSMFDYRNLACNIIPKKKQLRKMMIAEYTKEYLPLMQT